MIEYLKQDAWSPQLFYWYTILKESIYMDLQTQFFKVYANLPLGLRDEIIVVIDNEPLTWQAARIEIENNTPKGQAILEQLKQLKILPWNQNRHLSK